ncbi:hypothetical protein [Aureispira sp. CCB-QB1]|uniref:DUF3108 domain-containing protein n=1 Tax=Aureispira sp. CCB-QB1 TaxID=1313421 RepID=UPI000696D082|nr:hypothetical protein [Aureispira sp. CCB-QB1]
MKYTFYVWLIVIGACSPAFSQKTPLSPLYNPAKKNLIQSETSEMDWFMLNDSLKIPIGNIQTKIQRDKEKIQIIKTISMKQSPVQWIDSTVVGVLNFEPIYHSSFNAQRDMVLNFGEKVTGYYLDKKTAIKTPISEKTNASFFDSNFYPELVRLLPLKNGYSNTISIFDYNPTAKIGVVRATIRSVKKMTISFKGKKKQVWVVETTDDISNNSTVSTYYIDRTSRKILKQEIDLGDRKMVMESVE